MNRPRRVAVTAPPEHGGRPAAVRAAAEPLDPALVALVRRVRRAQLRWAAITLAGGAVLLLGLPVLLYTAPALTQWRGTGLPLGWIAVAWLPYPLLAGLAWWHLRRAERTERTRAATDPHRPAP
ncbi:hypothetical protein [Pseudonocardia sp. HH130630-07]|uniref:hypothetical protein n=1 Tax=Pseudonocardia sp. HH130630-07 TaxID=1690815 RepID=UPI000814FC51|nr:hypothetical protein [Pseudonocardia sp. HH130630-07]ANY05909.1 hypothetical protein AFB00_05890 [Pseudonocardia sp. HH130630-07]